MEIPIGHRPVITKDNSLSLYNESFKEHLHSLEGAKSETIYNFIEGCELRNHQGELLRVLEIGFGTGLGFFTTWEFLKLNFPLKKLIFYSLEIDLPLAKWALKDLPFFEDENGIHYVGDLVELHVLIGDACSVLPNHKIGPIDAIYQDPFSPKKNPTLWTERWFSELYSLAGENCILSTYSASTSIRLSMLNAGWAVFDRKGFSGKRSSTLAKIKGETPKELRNKLLRSDILPI